MMKENNIKGKEDREKENNSNITYKENTKRAHEEEKSLTRVKTLEYATDTSASRILKPKPSDSKRKTFSTKCTLEKGSQIINQPMQQPSNISPI